MCGSPFSSVHASRGGMGTGNCPRAHSLHETIGEKSSFALILDLSLSANFFPLICKCQQISFSHFKYVNKHPKHWTRPPLCLCGCPNSSVSSPFLRKWSPLGLPSLSSTPSPAVSELLPVQVVYTFLFSRWHYSSVTWCSWRLWYHPVHFCSKFPSLPPVLWECFFLLPCLHSTIHCSSLSCAPEPHVPMFG